MILSVAMKKLIAKVPNNSIRNYGAVINVTENMFEFTDGFSLIRLKNLVHDMIPGCYSKENMKREIVVKGAAKPSHVKYPNTEAVMPLKTTKVITVNGKILADSLNVICADSKDKAVRLETNGDGVLQLVCDDNLAIIVEVREEKK